jgi:GWxTD domain-containing protein
LVFLMEFLVLRVTLAALALHAGLPESQHQASSDLILRAVRSYRAEQGRTEVNAFMQVPYSLMEASADGPDGVLSYRVLVKVTDSTGLTLHQQEWQNHAPATLRQSGASAVDLVQFSIAPGRYRLEVRVRDSVSGRQSESSLGLEGFRAAPAASDLLLSPRIRPVSGQDTIPQPAELRWGQMLVTAAAHLRLTPLRTQAYYLLEAYSKAEDSGSLTVKVSDTTGKVLVETPTMPIEVPAGGGVLKGQLDLGGLPPGGYIMTASLLLGGKAIERSARFSMAELEETLEREVARREAARVTDEGYFEAMSEEELDQAREPLILIALSGELAPYRKELSPRAKRKFLADFWKKRDPTPATPVNEVRDLFYDAVAHANETYGEPNRRRSVPGWKTDLGRVYIRNGPPDETFHRREGRSDPYEVWQYHRGKNRYYIFVDRSGGLGLYQLVHSNDVKESGLPDWKRILHKADALIDISRFLGVDPIHLSENELR